jgi:hypothetical protein
LSRIAISEHYAVTDLGVLPKRKTFAHAVHIADRILSSDRKQITVGA